MQDKFYITSPIFYPNAKLHMGHAYTMTLADTLARWHKLTGKDVKFLTGADENTGKVVKAALDAGKPLDEFLSDINKNFQDLYEKLGVEYSDFIRTTDKSRHWPGAEKLWNKLVEAGDIYKSKYSGLYCPQCEAFYTEKEVPEGKCPLHGIALEKLEEENYFFRLSKYSGEIKKNILNGRMQIVPETRKNEILALIDRGLEDISFSRPAGTVPHGIPVPGDDAQVMYVWCDALTSYISAIGYGTDEAEFKKWWPVDLHVMGKDILRFHAAIWPAMLLSAGVELPRTLFVHGFITFGGQKMSKSVGNVIDPLELIEAYGKDAVRYYLLAKVPTFEDGDLTPEIFKSAYNGDLANGLGNLTARIMRLAESNLKSPVEVEPRLHGSLQVLFDNYEINKAMHHIQSEIGELDLFIQEKKPWETKDTEVISELVTNLAHIGYSLAPFMPETSEKILLAIKENKMPEALFPRKD